MAGDGGWGVLAPLTPHPGPALCWALAMSPMPAAWVRALAPLSHSAAGLAPHVPQVEG